MTVAVVNEEGFDHVYLCVRGMNEHGLMSYQWRLITKAGGQLSAPVIEGIADSTVTWREVADAVSYNIYVDGALVGNVLVPNTSYNLDNAGITEPGTYLVQLRALAASGSEYTDSPISEPAEYKVADNYFKFVSEAALSYIPEIAEKCNLPETFKTEGVTVHYVTVGEQYEYFAYPATYNELQDVIQSEQHVLGNYTKLENTFYKGKEYRLYRTTLQQVYDDSDYIYYTFVLRKD